MYRLRKIADRSDPHSPSRAIPKGMGVRGQAYVPNEDSSDWKLVEGQLIPVKGFPVMVRNPMEWLTTSRVDNFYIHESEETADKVILPAWCPLTVFDGIHFKKGDVVIQTLNSFYFVENQAG